MLFALVRMGPWSVQESPRYLAATDQLHDARSAVEQISEANGDDRRLQLDDVRNSTSDAPRPAAHDEDAEDTAMLNSSADQVEDQSEATAAPEASASAILPQAVADHIQDLTERSEPLFQAPNRRPVLLTWTLWALMSLAFTMFNAFYPLYLQRKVGKQSGEAEEMQALYDYLWYALSSIPGSLIGTALIESPLGRAKALAISLFVTAIAQLVFLASEQAIYVVISGMSVSLAATTAYAILYGYTPDVFPTSIRGTACAVASALGRLTGIIAPLLAGVLLQIRIEFAVITSAMLFVICAATALMLPSKTRATAVQL
ncbi:hypothetical protein MYAM1_001382 [Malassezia yamatoensis]|uniref:Major facilitator superfamily (MFS) profile domain-containing protein n=1 Tax=Malassezia yamatoensis TaxID=253288 RepID=A0AAJ6CIB1_9BASI|nr:hypothetical protein MYAM1_001382 [Malassezia yamatoensis]